MKNCPECNKEISDQAYSCPNCGHPIRPMIIEQTRKKWKLIGLIAAILFIVGMLLFVNGLFSGDSNDIRVGMGVLFMFIGFFMGMYSRIGAWWTNR